MVQPIRKRHFLLFEVLIAFAIVAFAFLPLISPHIYIYQEQHRFLDKIELDLAVNQMYAEIFQRLQRNEYPWNSLENKQPFAIDQEFLRRLGYHESFPFTGQYQFSIAKEKKNEHYGLYQINLVLFFDPINRSSKEDSADRRLTYEYVLFIARIFKAQESPEK